MQGVKVPIITYIFIYFRGQPINAYIILYFSKMSTYTYVLAFGSAKSINLGSKQFFNMENSLRSLGFPESRCFNLFKGKSQKYSLVICYQIIFITDSCFSEIDATVLSSVLQATDRFLDGFFKSYVL